MSSELEDFEAGIQRTEAEMYAAEDALLKAGFSAEHWTLIRKYVRAEFSTIKCATDRPSRIGCPTGSSG